ncbi:hypothetical protein QQF64_010529 [Cirrhinus molitorella]|uniref:Secreted protein n=1 Tax=Cirrhinus molitorella TaxID=172907 RepID=A0ABR3M4A9_9TELE
MKSRCPHLQRALPQKQHLRCLLFLHVAVGQARAIAFPSRAAPPVRLWDLLRGLFISCHFHQHAGTRRTRIITVPVNCGLVTKQGPSLCSLIPIQSARGRTDRESDPESEKHVQDSLKGWIGGNAVAKDVSGVSNTQRMRFNTGIMAFRKRLLPYLADRQSHLHPALTGRSSNLHAVNCAGSH